VPEVGSKIAAALRAAVKQLNKLSISQEKPKKEISAGQDEFKRTSHKVVACQEKLGNKINAMKAGQNEFEETVTC
jgi:septation ring formation regulator EzrA